MRARDISKYIIEGLLGEQSKEKVAIYGGSFRPPTKSDYQLLEKAIEEDPSIDKFIIYVGDSESEGLDQSDAIKIWEMYKKHLPRQLFVFPADPSPVQAVYEYSDNNPHKDIVWLFGVREGNSEDFKDVADRTKSIADYPNISIKPIVVNEITEREAVAAANSSKQELEKYIPDSLTYKEIDDIYDMLKPKELNEIIYNYPDDVVEKIVDEGWEYVEIMGTLPNKAAKVAILAGKRKKKLFSLAYERDSTTDPPIHNVNIFWSNEGDGPSRDIIEGGTMKDFEDIRDAGQLNLNEIATDDLAKLDQVIKKIVDNGYKQYQRGQRLTRFHRSTLIDDMKKTAEEDGVPGYFSLSIFPSGNTQVHFSTGETFLLDDLSQQDIKDIEDAADINLQEVVNKDITKFEEVIEKIVDEGWKYLPVSGADKWMPNKVYDYLAWRGDKDNKKYFYIKDAGPDEGSVLFFPYERTNYSFEKMTDEELNDVIQAGNLNEVADQSIGDFEEVVSKIVDTNAQHYFFTESPLKLDKAAIVKQLEIEEKKTKRPRFSVLRYRTAATVVFSDGKHFTLVNATDQDIADILEAADVNKINEVADKDLARFEQVIEKIIAIGARHYAFPDNNTRRYTADRITDVLKDIEEVEGSPMFAIDKYANGVIVHFSDGTRYPIDADEQDIEDIKNAASLNEVATVDLNKWDEVLDMIVDEGYEYYAAENLPIHNTPMPAPKTALYLNASKKKKKLFTVIKNISGGGPLGDKEKQTSLEIYLAEPDTPEVKRFYIHNTTDEDVEDLLGAAGVNVESINEATNLARFEELLNKIADGDYYYVPSMGSDMHFMAMQQKRVERSYDLNKPLFSYIWDGREIAAVFSDEPENFFWIFEATKEDKQDLVDAVKTFMSKIPLDKMKKTLEESVHDSVHDSVHELGHYKDITTFMNDNGLKLEPFPTLKFIDDDEENAEDLFGKTAYYDPHKNSIVLYTYGRHPKDILRSFAHELVHVHQNHEGRLNGINTTNTNEDDYLEGIEREAYEKGNILFRKWTDQVKEGKKNYGIDAYAAELARLRENIDPKAQKKHKGKAAPFGSAYKEIDEDIEIDITIESGFKLYCDLNNVLSDGGDEELNWNDDGKTLWDYIKKYDVIILSNDSNVNNKINFINENLPERKTYIFKNKDEKQFYARYNTILIDNREKTIENWVEAGGVGIVHHNTKQTIDQLKQLGL
jgi:hypothetical protein